MNIWYILYVELFRCARRAYKMVTNDISVPIHTRDPVWLSLNANMLDGTDKDVTDLVRLALHDNEIVTPSRLVEVTGLNDVKEWSYLTKTLEYNIIPSQGVNNGL